MERACDFIEKTRDPKNNLFLVGPACNLLAPSYGGVKQPDGTFGKGYLAGLSITYLAALDRMVELYKLTGDKEKLAEYERRQDDHPRVAAAAADAGGLFRQVDRARRHEARRVGPEEVRLSRRRGQRRRRGAARGRRRHGPVDLQANRGLPRHPALRLPVDQRAGPGRHLLELRKRRTGRRTPRASATGSTAASGAPSKAARSSCYYRLGKFDDIRRSAERAMKWAKDFRMDAPWSQRGENTNNLWSDSGQAPRRRRGRDDRQLRHSRRNDPRAVRLRLSLRPADPASPRAAIDHRVRAEGAGPVRREDALPFLPQRRTEGQVGHGQRQAAEGRIAGRGRSCRTTSCPTEAKVEIVTEGGWDAPLPRLASPSTPPATTIAAAPQTELPDSLKKPYAVLTAMDRLLAKEPNAEYEQAFVREAIGAIEAWLAAHRRRAAGIFPTDDCRKTRFDSQVLREGCPGHVQRFCQTDGTLCTKSECGQETHRRTIPAGKIGEFAGRSTRTITRLRTNKASTWACSILSAWLPPPIARKMPLSRNIFQSDHSVSSSVSGQTYDYIVKLVHEYGQYPLRLGEHEEACMIPVPPNPLLGVTFHSAGAMLAANCYAPQKYIRRWSWEIFWMIQAAWCWLLWPIIGAICHHSPLVQVLPKPRNCPCCIVA